MGESKGQSTKKDITWTLGTQRSRNTRFAISSGRIRISGLFQLLVLPSEPSRTLATLRATPWPIIPTPSTSAITLTISTSSSISRNVELRQSPCSVESPNPGEER
jgi:hypothetical protein